MISSAAFPKVAFNSPPQVGPVRSAKCSVDSPIRCASGIIPSAARKNVVPGSHPRPEKTE